MTSRELTGLLSLSEARSEDPLNQRISDTAWRLAFGAIGWPWLLRSLSGGTKAQKRALLDRLGLAPDALPHLGSWKADTGFLKHIIDRIEQMRPANVVELGAGASTLIAARALALHGGGRLTSFDQHGGFVEATRGWLADNGLSVDIRHAPLEAKIHGWPGRWYDIGALPERIDLIVIDGPPWSVHPLVRGAADSLFSRLSPGGVILLDDAARPGERLVARAWRKRWPDIDFTLMHDGTKGTLVGVKRLASGARPAHAVAVGNAANDNGRTTKFALRAVGMLALLATGWIARGALGEFPAPANASSFVDEAVASHRTGLLREAMASQVESPRLDSAEIRRSTGISVPTLPAGWRVRDVQLYPTEGNPAIALSLTTPQAEPVSLLVGKAETPAEGQPLVERRSKDNVAYWEEGELALALTGAVPPARALALAAQIAGRTQS
ncbi:class I SAM-dependent methyltransferase [Sphingobium sp. H39-3-25]|uniref:class I SAM-dependent methyltransferase n=1 Tax=Sphingobium arseniciresistens TaxID=3030834 RepID=UPI0023B97DDB|nr:class I SAM-dependent methyltransferase [Sphingobium arseniciresistens]